MSEFPDHLYNKLKQAKKLLADQTYPPSEGVRICFEILASFPDFYPASDLILEGISGPNVIQNYRKAIANLIDEWDDRPWQQRRRLALSFNYFSARHQFEMDELAENKDQNALQDVKHILDEGDSQLAQAYFSGVERGAEVAWAIYQEAIRRTHYPFEVRRWIANNYAHKGFFGEALDVLETAQHDFFQEEETQHLWVEVRWWCDHHHQIPWIPPDGNGELYNSYLQKYDPERWAFENTVYSPSQQYRFPNLSNLPPDFILPQPLPEILERQLTQILHNAPSIPAQSSVDWSYLNKLIFGEVDISKFPKWAQDLLNDVKDSDLRAEYAADFFARFSESEVATDEEDEENEN